MTPKPHDFLVTLRRPSTQHAWGIRLVGGTDLNAPLIVTRVQVNSPAQPELLRGDIITKIDQYDARDLTHNDAQNLFRNAGNQIKVTVRRDDKVALHQSAHPVNGGPAPGNFAQPYQPYVDPSQPAGGFHQPSAAAPGPAKPQLHQNFPPPDPQQLLPSITSTLPHGPQAYAAALEHPLETLPRTMFPGVDETGAYHLPKQPYPPPAPAGLNDASEALSNQVVHKQFNSPIGLYSDNNIEHTIRQSAPQQHLQHQQQQQQQTQTVPIFIDLSFLKQKQKILDEQRRLEQEKQAHKQYPFPSYASPPTSGRSSRQQTVSPPPPVPPLPQGYHQHAGGPSSAGQYP